MKITTLLLKAAAAKGLTLAQIGEIFCRPDEDDTIQSLLECIVQKATLCSSLKYHWQAQHKDSLLAPITKAIGDATMDQEPKSKIPKVKSFGDMNSSQ